MVILRIPLTCIRSYVFGYALDVRVARHLRARAAWVALFVITMVIWGGGYAWQNGYTRAEAESEGYVKMDWTDSGYVGPMFLYMFYGFYDAAWQTAVYWCVTLLEFGMFLSSERLLNFAPGIWVR